MILHDLISYDILRVIWWVLLGILLIGFAATDGFDMGTAAMIPFIARTDTERRVVINTVGPVWEGNQVWFILGGGAIFAAWPPLYAVSFSGFYLAMFVVLASFIVRPVAFKYRSKRDSVTWRRNWDWALCISGAVPALLFGVAVGNVIQGVPFHLTDDLHTVYEGAWYTKFIGLLDPFSLLAGVVSLSMLIMHGGAWVNLKAEGDVAARARAIGSKAALVAVAAYVLAGIWLAFIPGFTFAGDVVTDGPSNPLYFTVERSSTWLTAYGERPWIVIAPALGIVCALLTYLGLKAGREVSTMLLSGVSVLGVISSVGLTMFPFIMPSSSALNSSLAVWNSSSSHLTLFIMLVCAVIFVPIIIAYTSWVYKVLWGKVTEDEITNNSHSVY
ncbi:cytochrome d ubiquinol oxidase subunit II [Thioclava sp. GXIMD4216]|uniref:Cytochrome d ubiquinol oxidase subunit II n=1 Tax=Thioclava litoralis TaxID=3076557 RepID=A0ABZ1DY80_9RHOB|nr:cytochrome d ubiquinol oxidase subunit II [Thioclava sp. FTW29]